MAFISFFYQKYLKMLNNKKCNFGKNTEINKRNIFLGNNFIGENSTVYDSKMGFSSYVAANSRIVGAKIGNFCSIASNVDIIIGNHPINLITTHPVFYSLEAKKVINKIYSTDNHFIEYKKIEEEGRLYNVIIGNDVWIGANVSIMSGVKIGNGAIIGANSLVLKDVPPYSIVVGIPASIKKMRFSNDIIERFEKEKWWDILEDDFLYEIEKYLDKPNDFLEFVKKYRGNKHEK